MANLMRRGLTWFVRLHIPADRQADVGRALGASGGLKREVVRTLQTTAIGEARHRRDPALAAIRVEVDAALIAAKLKPLTDWTADWTGRAVEHRSQLHRHGGDVIGTGIVRTDEHGEIAVDVTAAGVMIDDVQREAQHLGRRRGAKAQADFEAIALGAGLSVWAGARQWLAEEEPKIRGSTIALHRTTLARLGFYLAQHHGHPPLEAVPLASVDRRTAGDFVAFRLTEGARAATVKREASTFNGLWRWARRRGHVESNPWEDQTAGLRDSETGPERGYTAAELVTLLRAGRDDLAPGGGGYAATFWDLMRLSLLTGARANELLSLRRCDVVADGAAIAVAAFSARKGQRAGKTANAPRIIPLHAFARRVVVDRLASLPPAPDDDPLWPEVPAQGPDQRRSKVIASRFPVIRRRLLGDSDEVDFHSFRRSHMTAAETALHNGGRISDELMKLLGGHARGSLALDLYSDWTRMGRGKLTGALSDRLATLQAAIDDTVDLGLPADVLKALAETADQRPPVARTAPAFRRVFTGHLPPPQVQPQAGGRSRRNGRLT